MEGLGRVLNFVETAAGAWINVRDCDAVTFICNNSAAETYTITEAKDSSGTAAQSSTIPLVVNYYTTAVGGTLPWIKRTQAAANTVTNVGNANNAITVFAIDVDAIDPLYAYVKVAVSNSGLVHAVLHDLDVMRPPARLIAPGV